MQQQSHPEKTLLTQRLCDTGEKATKHGIYCVSKQLHTTKLRMEKVTPYQPEKTKIKVTKLT